METKKNYIISSSRTIFLNYPLKELLRKKYNPSILDSSYPSNIGAFFIEHRRSTKKTRRRNNVHYILSFALYFFGYLDLSF